MNKDNAKDYLPLVQALAEGKTVQINVGTKSEPDWRDRTELAWVNAPCSYRIKPEPQKFWVVFMPDGTPYTAMSNREYAIKYPYYQDKGYFAQQYTRHGT